MRSSSWRLVALSLVVAGVALARPASGQSVPGTVQPGAPGKPSRVVTPGELAKPARPRHTEADVRFVQGMIPHHAQALEMTSLVPERTTRPDLRLLAERIEVSQKDEIAWMQRWIEARQGAPSGHDAHQHHGHAGHHALMPGMLSKEEMAQLAQASGAAFDRLFLEFMIRHHEGALTMVSELLATPGAAQETEVFRFASDVEADQRMEIRRMRAMLAAPPGDQPRP